MDVTFLKTDTFFSLVPNSSLQGETQDKELNWMRFDWFSGIKNIETTAPTTTHSIVKELIVESTPEESLEAKIVPPLSSVPKNPSLENITEVSSPTAPLISQNEVNRGYELPFRHNLGKPPSRYSR